MRCGKLPLAIESLEGGIDRVSEMFRAVAHKHYSPAVLWRIVLAELCRERLDMG